MIVENLRVRNIKHLTLQTVQQAMCDASTIVFVCEAQRQLYQPQAPSEVIYVGVPDPTFRNLQIEINLPQVNSNGSDLPSQTASTSETNGEGVDKSTCVKEFVFLCLGIVCPRKNQLWTVEIFQTFANCLKESRCERSVRLLIVGARETRAYEAQYLQRLREAIAGDVRIELFDVTDDVDSFFRRADCLLLTSLNEVTPMVISEAMSWGLPVISTDIAGIPEMLRHGEEGYLLRPGDAASALQAMQRLVADQALCRAMGRKARRRFETHFELALMVQAYRRLLLRSAPPTLLLDMDGVLVDWDRGFLAAWADRSPVDRGRSYHMEDCVPPGRRDEALALMRQEGFFAGLPAMDGALQAVADMQRDGLRLLICTSPLPRHRSCIAEKLQWVAERLGEAWLERVVVCHDKTTVRGDLLIDDKPPQLLAGGRGHVAATWQQVVFDAPYNRLPASSAPRLADWRRWREELLPLLGHLPPAPPQPPTPAPPSPRPISIHIQRSQDLLQVLAREPLSPEGRASILTGSASQLDEGSEDLSQGRAVYACSSHSSATTAGYPIPEAAEDGDCPGPEEALRQAPNLWRQLTHRILWQFKASSD